MDNTSRLITCYGVFVHQLLKKPISFILQRKNVKHKFKKFLEINGIRHVVARINHHQIMKDRWFGYLSRKYIYSIEEFGLGRR